MPGLAIINRNLQQVLRTGLQERVEFYSESLNISQFHDAEYEDALRE